MKRRGLTIKIKLSNRWLYTLIFLGILIAVGIGVYAFGTSDPSTFGHSSGELDLNGWSLENDMLLDDGEQVLKTDSEWLYLNPEEDFSEGIFTPGKIRAADGIYVGISEHLDRCNPGHICTTDDFDVMDGGRIGTEVIRIREGISISVDSSCGVSLYGDIRRCSSGAKQTLCACMYLPSGGWKWREIINY